MKFYSLFIVVLFFYSGVNSQTCFTHGITFGSQTEIDSFGINYSWCHEIGGNVTVKDTVGNNITNLAGLNHIETIEGNLFIGDNGSLVDLTGLDSLLQITGLLWVEQNDALQNFDGLNRLINIGEDITITNNQNLNSISKLSGITTIQNLYIGINDNLTSLQGLNSLDSVIGECLIEFNPSLNDLNGLGNLKYAGEFRILKNDNLASLNGISSLETISDDLSLGGNISLSDITALNSISTVNGDLWIGYNTKLLSLSGLQNISTIGGGVWIGGDTLLHDLTGLNISHIGDYLQIEYNTGLKYLDGLESLTSIGSYAWIGFNDSLLTLQSLSNLSSIGGNLSIGDNDTLFTMSGLEGISTIGGDLYIGGNYWLKNLNGLENLSAINGSMVLSYNTNLTNIDGVANIDPNTINKATVDMEIYNNDSLKTCHVLSVCDLLALPNTNTNIHDNKVGCNNKTEIENLCAIVPLEWGIPLSAQSKGIRVVLKGSVVQQDNIQYFIIERSRDGIEFVQLSTVFAEEDLLEEKFYKYIDNQPNTGHNYYRIKILDFDGVYSYSNTAYAYNSATIMSCFPNPVLDQLTINTTQVGEVTIYSLLGEKILSVSINKGLNRISTIDWEAGVYYLDNNNGDRIKIVKQ